MVCSGIEPLRKAGRPGQAHAVLGPKHARGQFAGTQASFTRAFDAVARSPDPITLPEAVFVIAIFLIQMASRPFDNCTSSY
jgi:hypothetical protein